MPNAKAEAENQAFAARLIALLEQHGHKRRGAGAYLVRQYGVAPPTANAWLNGEYRPKRDLLKQIAEDHGADWHELMDGPGGKAPATRPRTIRSKTESTNPTPQEIVKLLAGLSRAQLFEVVALLLARRRGR
jgi:transcriptional regulator with XRE-family HTH domain